MYCSGLMKICAKPILYLTNGIVAYLFPCFLIYLCVTPWPGAPALSPSTSSSHLANGAGRQADLCA
jgi:hypothetical protein